jgi:glycosyltransferase involved in cell wall biosynthesis
MHVAIDLRIVDAPGMERTGAGRYALEATRSLQRARPEWRFSLFSNRPELLHRGAARVLRTRFPTDRAVGRIAWLHAAAALSTARGKPDVWFSPAFVLPVWWRGRAVVTIHDLTFLLLRERYRGRANAWYATVATRWSASHADRVLCGSRETRRLLVKHLGVDGAKVKVIPYGVADAFFAESTPARPRDTRPYVLFVGTWEPRKGLDTLNRALHLVNADTRRVRLVLAGQPGWGTERLLDTMRGDPFVEFREKPSDQELRELYRGALALVYVSEMEGFGLPVAEAMASGCPVIASDLPPIREFAGDYPIYVSVGDSERLAAHIDHLLHGDPEAAERLARGRKLASALRWNQLGDQTADVLEEVAQTKGSGPEP